MLGFKASAARRAARAACRHATPRVRRHAFGEQPYGLLPSPAGGRGAGGEGGRCGLVQGCKRGTQPNRRSTLTRNRRFRPLPSAGEVGAVLALALLAACADPQPEPIDPADAVTEDVIDALPDGEFEALAVGERYDDVDGLVLAAVPMAPDVLVETEPQEDGRLLIKIEASGFEDDSVQAQRFDVIAERGADGLTVRKIDEMYKCYRDDSDEWTTELCP